jgi:hypothetical protein
MNLPGLPGISGMVKVAAKCLKGRMLKNAVRENSANTKSGSDLTLHRSRFAARIPRIKSKSPLSGDGIHE